jgi:sugar phosphate isomerase/epimerase
MADSTMKICLDIGHVNVNSSLGIIEWIEGLNDRIGHVHLHNNDGNNDDHNGLNSGTININEICDILKQNCPGASWNLEILTNIEYSLKTILELADS